MKDFLPRLPRRYLDKVVGPDQPHETMIAMAAAELAQRIDGVAGAETILDIGNADPRMPGHDSRAGHACGQGGHSRRRFKGILRRYEPPDLVQIQPSQGFQADMPVPVMRRVERSSQKADAPPRKARPERLFRCGVQDGDVESRVSVMAAASSRAPERPSTGGDQPNPVRCVIAHVVRRGHDLGNREEADHIASVVFMRHEAGQDAAVAD